MKMSESLLATMEAFNSAVEEYQSKDIPTNEKIGHVIGQMLIASVTNNGDPNQGYTERC